MLWHVDWLARLLRLLYHRKLCSVGGIKCLVCNLQGAAKSKHRYFYIEVGKYLIVPHFLPCMRRLNSWNCVLEVVTVLNEGPAGDFVFESVEACKTVQVFCTDSKFWQCEFTLGYAVLKDCMVWLYYMFMLCFGSLNLPNWVLDALKRLIRHLRCVVI